LNIDGTEVKSLSPLSGNTIIQKIYCDNTRISIDEINRFLDKHSGCLVVYQTEALTSWWNGLSSTWKYSFKAHTQVDDPPLREQLHAVAGLTALDLSGKREVINLDPIRTFTRLEDLNLANCALQDITPLSDLIRLKKLNLSGNPLMDLEPLGDLPGLKILDISNTPVEKLDDLKSISTLEQLNCSGTQIKKLDPVYYLSALKKLECQNTNINNLKPLSGLVELKSLVCYNTKLNDKKVEAFKAEMPGVEVVFY
jgi:Leucine-rich repeat (LRR) protein